jgi:8-oxo-dGTP pyrophosphatase MutT (NUDIX family)
MIPSTDCLQNKSVPKKKRRITTSYGIILVYIDKNNQLEFLIGKRRDSIGYCDFLRNNYDDSNINLYFSLMTPDERSRLMNHSFEDLWNDLWVSHNCCGYRDKYDECKHMFNEIKKSGRLNELVQTKYSDNMYMWEFPKGKKQKKELNINCALREFEEETSISSNLIDVLNIYPLIETFFGSNMKMYKTVYFLAVTQIKFIVERKHNFNSKIRNSTISDEIDELKWVSLDEAKKYIHPRRVSLLESTINLVQDNAKKEICKY